MERKEILEKIEQALERNLQELNHALNDYESASNLDEGDTTDPEDLSQQTEYKEMQMRMQVQLDQATSNLIRLRDLAVKDHKQAEAGALLDTDKGWFFLGVSLASMNVDGSELLGISSESPAYSAIKGKKAGESFTLGKNNYTIREIY